MLQRNHTAFLIVALLAAACASPQAGLLPNAPDDDARSLDTSDDSASAQAVTQAPPATTTSAAGLPFETPTERVNIRSPREVFATAKPYAESKPAVRANSRHAQPVTGKDCMSCHAAGGTAPQFAYGGTIKQGEDWDWKWNWPEQRDGASPATEVRVIGADGLVFQTVTDEDGNFWFKTRSPLQQPAFTGIRKGAFQRSLVSNGPACGSCHENGQQDARKEQPGPIWTWDGEDPGGDAWGDKWGDDWGGGGWGGGW